MIEIENVTKRYSDKTAVKNLSLSIAEGKIFAFLGPNGAGKTTTIKMLVGLLQPTEGSVKICNHEMSKESLLGKQNLAYVPDQPYLYDKLSGMEFLRFIGQMYGMQSEQLDEKIVYLQDLLNLDYLDKLCESYSHGMKQRVVFASALIHDPKVLIVDEPMVGLDPKSARIVKNIMKDHAKNGGTVFMSTHSLDVAEETAHHIGIIFQGELVTMGTLEDLRTKFKKEARLEEIFLQILYEEKENPDLAVQI